MPPQLASNRVVLEESRRQNEHPRWTRLVDPLRRAWPVKETEWKPFVSPPKSWRPDLLLVLGVLVSAALVFWPTPVVTFDAWLRYEVEAFHYDWLWNAGLIINHLGAGILAAPVVLALSVWASIRYNSIRPLLMYLMGFVSLGVILGMKPLLGRPLSQYNDSVARFSPDGPMLFTYLGKATAFPSGHAVNSIVFYSLAVMLIGAVLKPGWRRAILIGPPVTVLVAQTFIGYHWLWDAPAGFMLGILIIRMVQRVPWQTVPLGVLNRFEPATPQMILEGTALVVGLLVCAALPGAVGVPMGVVVSCLGVTWLIMRGRRR